MRKQEKTIVWPAYFDQTKTRKEGRRVPINLSIACPKIDEVQLAAQKLGLKPEVLIEVNYPRTPWQKTGMLKVEKKSAKEQIVRDIARQLVKMRSATSLVPGRKK